MTIAERTEHADLYTNAFIASQSHYDGSNDPMDISKIEAGHLELDSTNFELRSVVEEACQMFAEQAHGKGLEIGHWIHADVPLTVHGDQARLRQILLHLLSNAVKFTAAGEVLVCVFSQGDDYLRFEVSDTGVGIDDYRGSRLFEAFVQADQSRTRQHGGMGLGLAISRHLVQRMGGETMAHPRECGGSVFCFTAKLPKGAGVAEPFRGRTELRGLRTLIVDDNATNRTILEHYLEGWGLLSHSVDGPANAIDALERASRGGQPFELAVLDFNMPRMNGIELAQEIRKRPALSALRIVVLSSSPLEPGQFAGLGVSAILLKPARQAAIHDAIADAFAQTAPRVTASAPDEDVLDPATILQLQDALTPQRRKQLVDTFEEQQEKCVGDIVNAVQRGDRGEVTRVAHLLRGSGAILGANRLRLYCQGLEYTGREEDPEVGEEQIEELRIIVAEAREAVRQRL